MSHLSRALGENKISAGQTTDVAGRLMRAGARPNLGTFRLAIGYGQTDLFRILSESGEASRRLSRRPEMYLEAAFGCQVEILDLLRDEDGKIPNSTDGNKDTPLHMAARAPQRHHEQVRTMKLLIEAGADINCPNQRKDTPLHMANTAQATKTLLEAGAKVEMVNRFGQTALFYARSKQQFDLLLKHGADPHWRDDQDHGAVWVVAKRFYNLELVEHMLERGLVLSENELADPGQDNELIRSAWEMVNVAWRRRSLG